MNLQPRRILIRSPNWLGDAVMTTPALLRLRQRFPAAHLTLLVPEKLRDLWLHHPALNETISFAADESVFTVSRRLRAGAFDLALVLPNSPRSALEVFLSGIPRRAGYARPWRNWFLTQAVPARPGHVRMHKRTPAEIRHLISQTPDPGRRTVGAGAHQLHEYLHLVAALGANPVPLPPQLAVTPEEMAATRKKFGLAEVSGPVLGLNPGAEYGPAKRWPAARFIAAAGEIQRRTGCHWLVFGGKGDVELAGRIVSGIQNSNCKIENLAGKTSLRELMALLASCRVLLTNDTGPMHAAAALGVPVVALFGSTSPELTGPVFSPDAVILQSAAPCAPCFLRECPVDFRCMNGIAVTAVADAVSRAVGGAI